MALIVAVSLLGIALEKRTLALKRAISLQMYRADQLEERRAQLKLRCEQLGAPARLLETVEFSDTAAREAASEGRRRSVTR